MPIKDIDDLFSVASEFLNNERGCRITGCDSEKSMIREDAFTGDAIETELVCNTNEDYIVTISHSDTNCISLRAIDGDGDEIHHIELPPSVSFWFNQYFSSISNTRNPSSPYSSDEFDGLRKIISDRESKISEYAELFRKANDKITSIEAINVELRKIIAMQSKKITGLEELVTLPEKTVQTQFARVIEAVRRKKLNEAKAKLQQQIAMIDSMY